MFGKLLVAGSMVVVAVVDRKEGAWYCRYTSPTCTSFIKDFFLLILSLCTFYGTVETA